MNKHSFSERCKYRFDRMMSRGNVSMVKMLLVATLIAVLVITLAIHLLNPPEERDLAGSLWDTIATVVNAWMPYSDEGGAGYILLTALAAVTGLLFTSILIGIIATAIEEKITGLKDGNSVVLEQDHIVVLGFIPGEYTLIRQLIAAARGRKQCILIAGEQPRSETESAIRENVEIPKNIRLICRSVTTGDIASMAVCSIPACKTVVVNQPDDESTVKSMLAAYRILSANGQTDVSVISNMTSASFLLPQEIAADMNLISVCVSDIIARVIAHSCTETGISRVYSDLFDIEGGSLRILRIPGTAGKSFGSVLRTMDGAVPVGVAADGQILLNPAPELRIPAEETLVCWTEEDRQITFTADTLAQAAAAGAGAAPTKAETEDTVVIGCSPVLETLLRELPECPNAVIAVGIPQENRDELQAFADLRENVTLSFSEADLNDEEALCALLSGADHVVLLADGAQEDGDVLSILRYLRINNIKARRHLRFSLTLELRSEKNLQLIAADAGTDFIVAPHIVSMFLAQLSDCPDVAGVFRELLSNSGSEIHLKPASVIGTYEELTVAQLRARLLNLKMIPLGYVSGGRTVLNPALGETLLPDALDSLVVVSES